MSRLDEMDILMIDRRICDSINDDDDLLFHHSDTWHLLDKYEDLLEKGEPTRSVVIEYLKEVGRPLSNICIKCEEDLLEPYEVCEECGCSQGKIFLHESSDDNHSGSSKSDYNRLENFRKVLDRFQARQSMEIPRKVYDGLMSHFAATDVSKRDIRAALKKLGLSKYYGDVHLIHHEFTGVAKNDIREYEDDVLYDFDCVSRGFKGRNFFNTQYVLFELLMRRGYQCDRNEFFIPKTCKEEVFSRLCDARLKCSS